MSRILPSKLFACVTLSFGAAVSAQRPALEVLLVDGSSVVADSIVSGAGSDWELSVGAGAQRLDGFRVLCVLGGRAAESSLPKAHLAGGEVVRGLLVGGGKAGDDFQLQSPTLGLLELPVDRLECLVLRPEAAELRDLALPEGASEALFLPAALGFDRVVGTLHQFGAEGIRFQADGEPEPKWRPWKSLVGVRIDGAEASVEPPIAELVTRSGDRVGLKRFAFSDGGLRMTLLDGAERTIALADLGCLLRLDVGARFASRLEPRRVVESSLAGDALMPWRADYSVGGSMLAAGGRCYARGIGVHSRSRLEFVVPDGARSFLARVAFDDSALQLRVRGHVEVEVRVGDRAPSLRCELAPADGPRNVGPIAVEPGQLLSLEVGFGKGLDSGDRVDWLLCAFLPESPTVR